MRVIMITALRRLLAVEAIQNGAADYLSKPFAQKIAPRWIAVVSTISEEKRNPRRDPAGAA